MLDKFNSLTIQWKVLVCTILVLLLCITLNSCRPSQTVPVGQQGYQNQVQLQPQYAQPSYQQVQPQAAPVVVQQAAPSHDGFLTGMLMGHLMSSPLQPHYSAPAPVAQHTTINKTVVVNRPANNWTPPKNTYRYPAPQPTRSYVASRSFSRGR